jgi:hypothetical protein
MAIYETFFKGLVKKMQSNNDKKLMIVNDTGINNLRS